MNVTLKNSARVSEAAGDVLQAAPTETSATWIAWVSRARTEAEPDGRACARAVAAS